MGIFPPHLWLICKGRGWGGWNWSGNDSYSEFADPLKTFYCCRKYLRYKERSGLLATMVASMDPPQKGITQLLKSNTFCKVRDSTLILTFRSLTPINFLKGIMLFSVWGSVSTLRQCRKIKLIGLLIDFFYLIPSLSKAEKGQSFLSHFSLQR